MVSSTATTVAAFIPLLMAGIIGNYEVLPMTLMIVLASSLFVALVINPVLAVTYTVIQQVNLSVQKCFYILYSFCSNWHFFILLNWISIGNLSVFVGILLLVTYLFSFLELKFFSMFLPRLERIMSFFEIYYWKKAYYILSERSVYFLGL